MVKNWNGGFTLTGSMSILRLELKDVTLAVFFILLLLLEALNESLGLKLVGPHDILSGTFDDVSESDITSYHLHWRYFYDPPEFLTIIKGDDKTGYHLGYYRLIQSSSHLAVLQFKIMSICVLLMNQEHKTVAQSGLYVGFFV